MKLWNIACLLLTVCIANPSSRLDIGSRLPRYKAQMVRKMLATHLFLRGGAPIMHTPPPEYARHRQGVAGNQYAQGAQNTAKNYGQPARKQQYAEKRIPAEREAQGQAKQYFNDGRGGKFYQDQQAGRRQQQERYPRSYQRLDHNVARSPSPQRMQE
jgi:hypothetical protein